MPQLSEELLAQLLPIQKQVWQTVSSTVSEAGGQKIVISNPVSTAARTVDLFAEMSVPMMVVQFAFAGLPENSQVILVPQDTVLGWAELLTGAKVDEADENIVAELRTSLEALVQGICLSIGNLQSELVVATGLAIRFQIFSFPANLQRSDRLIRTQLEISGENLTGNLSWLIDLETAGLLLGTNVDFEEPSPFQVLAGGAPTGGNHRSHTPEDQNSLDLLMDVPLEMSVELGRVKMLVRDVLELSSGSILEIDKAAGEPVDVLVNGRIMARGEVVVIEDNFGVRITEIINPHVKLGRDAA
jgi:flagellar motor switch protein FliN/FliY